MVMIMGVGKIFKNEILWKENYIIMTITYFFLQSYNLKLVADLKKIFEKHF
jgi:hypothetical protein